MKTLSPFLKIFSILLSVMILYSGCASTTLIQSEPNGADLYIDGMKVGKTPYTYSDTKIVGSTTTIRMKKEGYEELNQIMQRNEKLNVGALIGGLFVWIPFLWIMNYNDFRVYELEPLNNQ